MVPVEVHHAAKRVLPMRIEGVLEPGAELKYLPIFRLQEEVTLSPAHAHGGPHQGIEDVHLDMLDRPSPLEKVPQLAQIDRNGCRTPCHRFIMREADVNYRGETVRPKVTASP